MTPDRYWAGKLVAMVREPNSRRRPRERDFDKNIADLLDNLACVNCGKFVEQASAYCGDYCKQFAELVRYGRRAAAHGKLDRDEFLEGAGIKLIGLLKGGYPANARRLAPAQREVIFQRDNHVCQICGDRADQIDHISGNSSDSCNLRAICGPCNRMLAMTLSQELTEEERAEFQERAAVTCDDLAARIAALAPLVCCDDHQRWQKWAHRIGGARRRLLREREEELEGCFEDVDGYLWDSMRKDD